MDGAEENMQYVGFFGIFRESFKTLKSWKKIFTQITLTFILPLTLIFLAHMVISHQIFSEIREIRYDEDESRYSRTHRAEWVRYWIFKLASLTCLLIFSLLSTAAIVYTIACVYTGREVTFKKVLKVLPRVWKKLMVTFLCTYLAFFLYNLVAGIAYFVWQAASNDSIIWIVIFFIGLILYLIGFLYMTLVWQLASVVTVLENCSGFRAMKKGSDLMKGKRWVSMGIFFVLDFIFAGIYMVFELFVVYGFSLEMLKRVLIGLVCFFLLLKVFLYGMVIQTVLYLVCKSHHREAIDKLSLSTQLGSYLGEYDHVSRPQQQVQLGQANV